MIYPENSDSGHEISDPCWVLSWSLKKNETALMYYNYLVLNSVWFLNYVICVYISV